MTELMRSDFCNWTKCGQQQRVRLDEQVAAAPEMCSLSMWVPPTLCLEMLRGKVAIHLSSLLVFPTYTPVAILGA
jgi:hypothetical protein